MLLVVAEVCSLAMIAMGIVCLSVLVSTPSVVRMSSQTVQDYRFDENDSANLGFGALVFCVRAGAGSGAGFARLRD